MHPYPWNVSLKDFIDIFVAKTQYYRTWKQIFEEARIFQQCVTGLLWKMIESQIKPYWERQNPHTLLNLDSWEAERAKGS